MDWTQFIVPGISGLAVIAVSIADIYTHRKTSARFNQILTEERKLKDEQIKTIEEKHEAMLAAKDEQIKTYEMLSSPHIMERFKQKIAGLEEIVDELNAEVDRITKAHNDVNSQLEQAKKSNESFIKAMTGVTLPKKVRNSVSTYVTASGEVLTGISQSTASLLTVGDNIKKSTGEITNLTSVIINPTPAEARALGVEPKVVISGPIGEKKESNKATDEGSTDLEESASEEM